MMRRDPELARACRAGDLILADGMSVVWSLRASGRRIPERVTGVDLMARLLAAAGQHRLRVYFLGARRKVVMALVERTRAQYPGIEIAGFRDGYFGPDDHLSIVEEIRASGAQMLFVGMPTPFKETWCERHRERLNVPLIIGVGGSFDVLAGFIKRAPRWVQSLGMEWFWRLLMEPRKLWKRYLTTNSEFIWFAGREIVFRRLGRPPVDAKQLAMGDRHDTAQHPGLHGYPSGGGQAGAGGGRATQHSRFPLHRGCDRSAQGDVPPGCRDLRLRRRR